MLTAFLITTLVVFSINLMLSLIVVGISLADDEMQFPIIQGINLIICLLLISWNIYILTTL